MRSRGILRKGNKMKEPKPSNVRPIVDHMTANIIIVDRVKYEIPFKKINGELDFSTGIVTEYLNKENKESK